MEAQEEAKKKWAWKVAPSKAPGRVLKKKLRDMERLIQKKDTLKDIPAEVIKETEKKIVDIKKQIEALGPQAPPPTKKQSKKVTAKEKGPKALKFTELRRAGRKIAAFKKQHPNYESSEEESKTLADLELDLLYIKNFPRDEEYISIYPESPLTDEGQLKTQAGIREKIEKALANGEIKKTTEPSDDRKPTADLTAGTRKHPASNWNDDESGDSEEGGSENEEPPVKKTKSN
ncbi:hypothetical protein BGZ72_002178 [Mortierella alpina]|nr:hypothetical protein BGZ72_002178 [Mortierella alpina]